MMGDKIKLTRVLNAEGQYLYTVNRICNDRYSRATHLYKGLELQETIKDEDFVSLHYNEDGFLQLIKKGDRK